jgi:hypothetical protein
MLQVITNETLKLPRFRVSYTHRLGASNTYYVYAVSPEIAQILVENRIGPRNITKITVLPY